MLYKKLLLATPIWVTLLRYVLVVCLFVGLGFAGNFKSVGDQLALAVRDVRPSLKAAISEIVDKHADIKNTDPKTNTQENQKCR